MSIFVIHGSVHEYHCTFGWCYIFKEIFAKFQTILVISFKCWNLDDFTKRKAFEGVSALIKHLQNHERQICRDKITGPRLKEYRKKAKHRYG